MDALASRWNFFAVLGLELFAWEYRIGCEVLHQNPAQSIIPSIIPT